MRGLNRMFSPSVSVPVCLHVGAGGVHSLSQQTQRGCMVAGDVHDLPDPSLGASPTFMVARWSWPLCLPF